MTQIRKRGVLPYIHSVYLKKADLLEVGSDFVPGTVLRSFVDKFVPEQVPDDLIGSDWKQDIISYYATVSLSRGRSFLNLTEASERNRGVLEVPVEISSMVLHALCAVPTRCFAYTVDLYVMNGTQYTLKCPEYAYLTEGSEIHCDELIRNYILQYEKQRSGLFNDLIDKYKEFVATQDSYKQSSYPRQWYYSRPFRLMFWDKDYLSTWQFHRTMQLLATGE